MVYPIVTRSRLLRDDNVDRSMSLPASDDLRRIVSKEAMELFKSSHNTFLQEEKIEVSIYTVNINAAHQKLKCFKLLSYSKKLSILCFTMNFVGSKRAKEYYAENEGE